MSYNGTAKDAGDEYRAIAQAFKGKRRPSCECGDSGHCGCCGGLVQHGDWCLSKPVTDEERRIHGFGDSKEQYFSRESVDALLASRKGSEG